MLQDSEVQASRDRTRARSGSSTSSALADSHGHAVQFYESDAFLVNVLARFVVNGLSRDEPIVVIATNPHVTALVETLRARRVDVDAARNAHQLCMVDAHGLLAAIMEQGMPGVERFNAAFDGILQTVARKASPAGIRVYGEMVDLLWQDGNFKAAIRLEEIWNERASSNEFFLLCAYALRGFPAAEDTSAIAEICRQHTRVTPTERFIEHDSIGRAYAGCSPAAARAGARDRAQPTKATRVATASNRHRGQARQDRRRRCESREESISHRHEPRVAHAAQRDRWLHRAARVGNSRAGERRPTGLARANPAEPAAPPQPHQPGPRLLQTRNGNPAVRHPRRLAGASASDRGARRAPEDDGEGAALRPVQ